MHIGRTKFAASTVTAVATTALMVCAGPSFAAEEASNGPVVNTTAKQASFRTTLAGGGASGFSVHCTGTKSDNAVRDPHLSKKAGGAIYKTVIKCAGSGLSSVRVRTQGLMTYAKSSDPDNTDVHFKTRAKSDQKRTVPVNGETKTFYTPESGANGGHGTGFWRATSTWYFVVDGKTSTVGSQTKTVWKKI